MRSDRSSLQALIGRVDTELASGTPLERLAAANDLGQNLRARGDELLDHFVDAAREADSSWTEIGCILGVSKQAAQQRFVALSTLQDGSMPGLTPSEADAFLEAAREARELGHHHVGPEHLVLGLLSQPEELGGRALA